MQEDMRLAMPASLTMVDGLPAACDAMLCRLKPAGPVYSVRLIEGRITVFKDDEPAPADDPWQQMADAHHNEADCVIVRAVSPSYPDPCVKQDAWALDPNASGHRAPFARGDLVVETNGYRGIHRVVDATVDKDAPPHRSLILTVQRAHVVIDKDNF